MFVLVGDMFDFYLMLGAFETFDQTVEARKAYRKEATRKGTVTLDCDSYLIYELPLGQLCPALHGQVGFGDYQPIDTMVIRDPLKRYS